MSQTDLEAAQLIIEAHADRARFVGPRDPSVVADAEATLGLCFPPSYRQFIIDNGAGSLRGREFYGVIDRDWEATVPDAVGLTLDERNVSDMPNAFILIGSTGDGDWYVLDTSQLGADGEAPVLQWMPGVPIGDAGPPQRLADSFGAFLLQKMREATSGPSDSA